MRLSIVQVATSSSGWGADELHVLDLAERLNRRGHRVTVACRPGRWVEQQAEKRALRSVPFTVLRQQDGRDLAKMVRFFRAHRVDVVHVHAHGDYVVPALAARLAGVPVRVMTGHHMKKLTDPRGARIYSDHLYTHVIAVSNAVRDILIESGMTAHRIGVIPYGVEVDGAPSAVKPPPGDTLIVGIVGRIASDTGHFALVEAARHLRGKFSLRYEVIGGGPEEDALRYRVAGLGLGDLFTFRGFRADMDGLIAGLDIVAVPGSSPGACSAVIQKAMLLGKPVVGSRAGGNQELILDGRTGFLIPPQSASNLAATLAQLAASDQLRADMGQAAQLRAETQYAIENMIDRIDRLYRSRLLRQSAVSASQGLMNPSSFS